MEGNGLKEGWKWVKLGDVAGVFSKGIPDPANSEYDRFVSSDCMDQFDLRVKRWRSAN